MKDMKESLCQIIISVLNTQQNTLLQAEIRRIKFHKLKTESMLSLWYAPRCRPRKIWSISLSCNHANQEKKKKTHFLELTCCMNLCTLLQAVSLASTKASLTNRNMDLFQPRCWTVWNAWAPSCEAIFPSEAHIVLITPGAMHRVNMDLLAFLHENLQED